MLGVSLSASLPCAVAVAAGLLLTLGIAPLLLRRATRQRDAIELNGYLAERHAIAG